MRKRTRVILFSLFAVLYVLVETGRYLRMHQAFAPVTLSAAAPDFEWQDGDGKLHHLSDLGTHPVVLHFWGAWCNPCRQEFPKLLAAAAQDKDVMFLTVASDADPEKSKAFVAAAEAKAGVKSTDNVFFAYDPEKKITYERFQTLVFPETIFIDAGQHLRRKVPGTVDWGSAALRAYLNQLH